MTLASYVPTSLKARRASAWKKYVPHKPFAKQAEFLNLECLEALYGGAAGGGKSETLLMDGLRDVDSPNYAGIIFRRTYQDLSKPGALLDRAHAWLHNTDAHWDGIKKQWRFPSGAVLAFGYLDNEKDKHNYQSAEFQYVAFDETTHFPEGWYEYLHSRLRRLVTSNVPIRMRCGTNPGGIGHEWVKARFVDKTKDGSDGNGYVQARLEDNPHIDHAEYRKALAKLDAVTRRQLEFGEWIQDASGLLYPEFSTEKNIIEKWPDWPQWTSLIGLDFGVVDMNAITVLSWREHDPATYVRESYQVKGLTEEVAAEVLALMKRYEPVRIVGDVGGLGKAFSEDMRRRFHIPVEPAAKTDKLGFIKLLNGSLGSALVKIHAPRCADLIHQLKTLPKDKHTGQEVPGFENHAADSFLYAWRESRAFLAKPAATPAPAVRSPEWYADREQAMKAFSDRQVEDAKHSQNEWDFE